MKYYVLEWNGLDDRIDLYKFESNKEDISEVYDEVSEGLHHYSSILVMNKERFFNLLTAVADITKEFLQEIKGSLDDVDEDKTSVNKEI